MPRGAPDYSNVRSPKDLYRLDDLAELAPRLHAVSSIDRSGNIVTSENFRYGLSSVETDTAGLGETVSASSTYSRYGGFTAKLEHLANPDSWSSISIYVPILETGKVGLEFEFSANGSDPCVIGYIGRYTGTQWLLWGVKWDATVDKVYIGGETVGWEEIGADFDILQDTPHHHNVKLVVDVGELNYERVIIDGKVVPIVPKEAQIVEAVLTSHVVVTIYNGKGPTAASQIYVDFVNITRDEP